MDSNLWLYLQKKAPELRWVEDFQEANFDPCRFDLEDRGDALVRKPTKVANDLFGTKLVRLHTLEHDIRQPKLHQEVLLSRAGCRLRMIQGVTEIEVCQRIRPLHLKRSPIVF